jgi:hypothetical protein
MSRKCITHQGIACLIIIYLMKKDAGEIEDAKVQHGVFVALLCSQR